MYPRGRRDLVTESPTETKHTVCAITLRSENALDPRFLRDVSAHIYESSDPAAVASATFAFSHPSNFSVIHPLSPATNGPINPGTAAQKAG